MVKLPFKNKIYSKALILVLIITTGILITKANKQISIESNQEFSIQPLTNQVIENSNVLNSPSNALNSTSDINNSSGLLVTRVIDGDTIELENGERVRYLGINTPESVDPRKPVECFGKEASLKNKELVLNKKVVLEKDISEIDKYGRLLRYVYTDDAFVNLELIKQGYAQVATYPPDVKYHDLFLEAEKEARENKRGLWGNCPTNNETNSPIISPMPIIAGCNIKGNINSEGEKIYHLPNCQSYFQTKIDENRGEKWFCSEGEALDAGWKKANNCEF